MVMEWVPHMKQLKTVNGDDMDNTHYTSAEGLKALRRSFDMTSIFSMCMCCALCVHGVHVYVDMCVCVRVVSVCVRV